MVMHHKPLRECMALQAHHTESMGTEAELLWPLNDVKQT